MREICHSYKKHTPIEFLLKYKLYFWTEVPRYLSNKTKTWTREMNLGIRGEGGRDISLKHAKLHAFLDLDCQSISLAVPSLLLSRRRENFLRFLFVFQIVLNSPIVKLSSVRSDVSELCIHQKVSRPHLRKM